MALYYPSTPLPENPFPIGAFHVAYKQCLTLEAEASGLEFINNCPPPIVCARLLGHLLRLAPAGDGQGQLQQEISYAKDHTMLMQVAAAYLKDFIHIFKRNSSGPTPVPSEPPSPPSLEDPLEYGMFMKGECGLDHHSAWTLAILRDDNRCMLTGAKDYHKEVSGTAFVEAVHIIPELTNENIGEHGGEHSGMWSILSMFTQDNIIEDLGGNRIHRLENIVSMNNPFHHFFDELFLWLKPVEGAPHKYHVCVAHDPLRFSTNIPLPEYITFSTATTLPLPHHKYLALHALCCEVAWMSGIVGYITDIENLSMYDTKVMANDGSTAELLKLALSFVEAP